MVRAPGGRRRRRRLLLATAAVGLLLPIAFGELQLWRIEAVVRPGNPASARVLEKNGFKIQRNRLREMALERLKV